MPLAPRLKRVWRRINKLYVGDHREALPLAERISALADKKGDAGARLIGDRLTGIALHYRGDHADARRHLERVLSQYVAPVHQSLCDQHAHMARFHTDHRVAARTTLSRILWIQGFPDQAVRSVRSTLDEARATDHVLSLCHVLAHAACPIALHVGDLAAAERFVAMLLEYSAKHQMNMWNALGRCLKGTLLLARGDAAGLALLGSAINRVREARFGFYETIFLGTLAQGMAAVGQTAQARTVIDEALERCERTQGRWCLPELLRIKGELLRLDGSANAVNAAEDHFMQAFEWARRQEALSWELRAATSLAELWHGRGKTAEAEQLLSSVYNKFSEGFETSDLKTAHALINELRTKL